MYPTLWQFGSVRISSLLVALLVGGFLLAFVVWRRWRELGMNEQEAMGLVLGSLGLGLVFGRWGYALCHFRVFGTNLDRWFSLIGYPGLSVWGFGTGFLVGVAWLGRKNQIGFWRLADEVIYGLSLFWAFLSLGLFLSGPALGGQTSFIWGVFFPGDMVRRHPVGLLEMVIFLAVWGWLVWVEKRWRHFHWYPSHKEGFLVLAGSGLSLIGGVSLALLKPRGLYSMVINTVISTGFLVALGVVFYQRSGWQKKPSLKAVFKKGRVKLKWPRLRKKRKIRL